MPSFGEGAVKYGQNRHLFNKMQIFRKKNDPFFQNRGHADFEKTDPFKMCNAFHFLNLLEGGAMIMIEVISMYIK